MASLAYIEEASKNARVLMYLLMTLCLYGVLTNVGITDLQMVTDPGKVSLPILQVSVPAWVYFLFFPFSISLIYLYLLLHLQSIWQVLSRLPYRLSDGSRLDLVVYPWLPNRLFVSYFDLTLSKKQSCHNKIRNWMAGFMIWWLAPTTLILFWFSFLKRQDLFFTTIHMLTIIVSLCMGAFFWLYCKTKFSGSRPPATGPISLGASVGGLCIYFSALVLCGGQLPIKYLYNDISEIEIATKSEDWDKITDDKEREEDIKMVDLKNRNFRFLNATKTFLYKVNFCQSNLQGATLKGSDLSHANLKSTDLRAANLNDSNLSEAILVGADLRESSMFNVILKGAILDDADLRDCESFSFTELMGPKSMERVILRDTNLNGWRLEDTERIVNEEKNHEAWC